MPRLLTRRRVLWLGLATLAGMGAVGGTTELKRQQVLALNDPNRDFTVVGEAGWALCWTNAFGRMWLTRQLIRPMDGLTVCAYPLG